MAQQAPIKIILFLIFLFSAYLYFPLNKRRSRYYWKSPIDRHIPLIPVFVLPYYFYLIYAPITLLTVWLFGRLLFNELLVAFIIANVTAAVVWFLFPNGIKRPKIKRKGLMLSLVRDLYSADKYDTNAFPSNHVYGAVICSYYLTASFPNLGLVYAVLGFLVVVSTILVKQHHLGDLIAGVFWAIVSINLANLLI